MRKYQHFSVRVFQMDFFSSMLDSADKLVIIFSLHLNRHKIFRIFKERFKFAAFFMFRHQISIPISKIKLAQSFNRANRNISQSHSFKNRFASLLRASHRTWEKSLKMSSLKILTGFFSVFNALFKQCRVFFPALKAAFLIKNGFAVPYQIKFSH